MIDAEWQCLDALHELSVPHGEVCLPFAPVMGHTGLDRRTVRRCIRRLARKGLAEFHNGLWNEDGEMAGAGYCITPGGISEYEKSRITAR